MIGYVNVMRQFLGGNKNEPSRKVDVKNDLFGASAYFSALAYAEPHKITSKMIRNGAVKIFTYSYEDLQAFFAEFDDFAVVSFKGTNRRDEFKTLFKFWKQTYCDIKVHAGFSDSIQKIAPILLRDLENLDRQKKLVYTGHSFGGAMALLLSLQYKPDVICTIGSPKVGGGEGFFERFKGIEIYRIQTKVDYITLLPPSFPIVLDYHHVGEAIYLDGINHPWETHRLDVYLKDIMRLKHGRRN